MQPLFTIPKMDNDPLSVARFGANIAGVGAAVGAI